eukprot:TRINITY_DN45872_c0_g1_i1.p1 TRINITY_DN45872_c0_g1~~TRINITY_DN45872_c0_g1_i1.p1  ORF type:complete len:411 (+),score=71.85 TRINITY_DN45872_c0_g1_i1:60-1235(+)
MEVTLPLDCKYNAMKSFDDDSTCSPSTPMDDAVFSFDVVESAACVLRDQASSEQPQWLDAALANAPWRHKGASAAAADRTRSDDASAMQVGAASRCPAEDTANFSEHCRSAPSDLHGNSPEVSHQPVEDGIEELIANHSLSVPCEYAEEKQGPGQAEANPQEPAKLSRRERTRRAKARKKALESLEMAKRAVLAKQDLQDRAAVTLADIGLLLDPPKSRPMGQLPLPPLLSTKPDVQTSAPLPPLLGTKPDVPFSALPTQLSSSHVSQNIRRTQPDVPFSVLPMQLSSNHVSQNIGSIMATNTVNTSEPGASNYTGKQFEGAKVFSRAHCLHLCDKQATRIVIPVAMPRREYECRLSGPEISSWIQTGLQQARVDHLTAALKASAPEVYED